jgi:hypothetical protein
MLKIKRNWWKIGYPLLKNFSVSKQLILFLEFQINLQKKLKETYCIMKLIYSLILVLFKADLPIYIDLNPVLTLKSKIIFRMINRFSVFKRIKILFI